MTRIIITLTIVFLGFEIAYSQDNPSYDYWEKRILKDIPIDSVINSLDNHDFKKYYSKRKIPKGLKDTLSQWEESRFKIANPNQRYNETDVVRNRRLPWRRISVIYRSPEYFLMIYRKGGYAINDYLMWCQLYNDKVVDIWVGYYRIDKDDIFDIKKYLVDNKDDLHTNFLSY